MKVYQVYQDYQVYQVYQNEKTLVWPYDEPHMPRAGTPAPLWVWQVFNLAICASCLFPAFL